MSHLGRTGRQDNERAYSLVLNTGQKLRLTDGAANTYRLNKTECRRKKLAESFPVEGW